MSKLRDREGLIGLYTALAASSYCLLPFMVMLLGLGSGALLDSSLAIVGRTFNIVTMFLATVIMLGVIWADFFAAM